MAVHATAITELRERVDRYSAGRYPVQRATALFHLGTVLADARRAVEAVPALEEAARLFERCGLKAEQAKAMNGLGVAFRTAGRPHEAARAFAAAAAAFAAEELRSEEGAAQFNLGLALRDAGELAAARGALARACELLDREHVPGEAASAARELGATLLEAGDAIAARDALEQAVALAAGRSDAAALGAAANALGLARLALDDAPGALEAFAMALAAHPRSVRPHEHAMVKANLALAYERLGDMPRARLAARQALGVPNAPPAVVEQATAILGGADPGGDDLARVLADESRERWPAIFREELVRWTHADPNERRTCAATLVRMQNSLAPPDAEDLAEAWLTALLELPTDEFECVVAALGECAEPGFRAGVERALARFHAPQMLRVKDTFGWS